MSDNTGIGWTNATWNVVTGCDKVSAGCKNCYALRDWARLAANPKTVYYGRAFTDFAVHAERLSQPLRWTKPRMIFVNSMSDLFHKDAPFKFIASVFGVMALATEHTFQILTKRPERMLEFFTWLTAVSGQNGPFRYCIEQAKTTGATKGTRAEKALLFKSSLEERSATVTTWPLRNVWLGVSAENQSTADERVPLLLKCPAAVRWVSAEPLLGPLELDFAFNMHLDTYGNWRAGGGIDWVVVGGESGPKARPMAENWALAVARSCRKHNVPFFFKQWGEWQPESMNARLKATKLLSVPDPGSDQHMLRVGSNAQGWDLLEGARWQEFPRNLQGKQS